LYESEKKEAQIELLKQAQIIQNSNMERQKLINYVTYIGILISLVFTIILYRTNRKKQKAYQKLANKNIEINAQKEEILGQAIKLELHTKRLESEKTKSDRLLRNILPDEVATELKEKGESKPRLYEHATIIFADFVNFTLFASNNSPQEITRKLDTFFLNFDMICTKNGLEKIKTIGDCYMAAGGLPIANKTNAFDAVKSALQMIEITKEAGWQIRIGIHTGPVVAGVIGINKFAYDVWGDTVNLASRLESTSHYNKINVSKEVFTLLENNFNFTYRGKIEAKNKGEMDMYFVESIKE
jgi:adenylate cyclase